MRGGEFMSSVANLDVAAMALLPQWVVPQEGGAPYAVVNSPPKSSLATRESAAVGWVGERCWGETTLSDFICLCFGVEQLCSV